MSFKKYWPWGLLFVLVVLVPRLSFFTEPLGISVDESTYMVAGEKILYGETLYKDAIDRKPPGVFVSYSLIQAIFGAWNIHGIHIVFTLISILLALSCWKLSGSVAGFWLFLVYITCFPRGVLAGNAEFLMLLGLAAFHLLFEKSSALSRGGQKWLLLFIAFSFVHLSSLMKQYAYLPFVLFYFGWMIDYARAKLDRPIVYHLSSIVLGLLAGVFVHGFVAWRYQSLGAFDEYFYWSWLDGFLYVADSGDLPSRPELFWRAIAGMLVSWPLLFYGFGKGFKRIPWRWQFGFLGALLTALMSGRYYTHYFVPAIWYLSVAAAPSVQQMWREARSRRWVYLGFGLPLLVYSVFNFDRDRFTPNSSFAKPVQEIVYKVGNEVKQLTSPEDRILVWGMASSIYVVAERGCATKFLFADFASGRIPGYSSSLMKPIPGMREDYLDEIVEHRPAVFVDTSGASINDYGHFPLTRFPELKALLEKDYEKLTRIEGVDLWKRKGEE